MTATMSARQCCLASCRPCTISAPTFSQSLPASMPMARILLLSLGLAERLSMWITKKALDLAAKHAGGKLVSPVEGGYDLDALASSTAAHVATLMGAS